MRRQVLSCLCTSSTPRLPRGTSTPSVNTLSLFYRLIRIAAARRLKSARRSSAMAIHSCCPPHGWRERSACMEHQSQPCLQPRTAWWFSADTYNMQPCGLHQDEIATAVRVCGSPLPDITVPTPPMPPAPLVNQPSQRDHIYHLSL